MFRTMREAELLPQLIPSVSGFQYWSLVELDTVWPWFQVETTDRRGHRHHKAIVLASNVQLLKDLLSAGDADAWVNEVQIITPGSMNGTESWKMETLENLYEVIDSSGCISGHDYVVTSGHTYSTVLDTKIKTVRHHLYTSITN